MGRKLKTVEASDVERLASQGLGHYAIANNLGIHYDTLMKIVKDNSVISAALKRGQALAINMVEASVYNMALASNLGAACYYLNNRASDRWSNKQEINHSGGLTVNLGFGVNNDAQSLHNDSDKQANEKQVN